MMYLIHTIQKVVHVAHPVGSGSLLVIWLLQSYEEDSRKSF